MITQQQYEEYKKLVEEYEQAEYDEAGMREDEEDECYEDELEEQRYNDRAERASNCRCGAWVFGNNGTVHHVADCICGAE